MSTPGRPDSDDRKTKPEGESPVRRQRIILEMGTGNDLHGESYTKAALRAVQDALHHSSLSLFKSLDMPASNMQIEVTIGVQQPGQVDTDAVAASLPYGQVSATAVIGGADLPAEGPHGRIVVASAAIAVWLDIDQARYRPGQP
ncbi:MAG: Lin0512 family protein [Burkholderiaceae bacterium]